MHNYNLYENKSLLFKLNKQFPSSEVLLVGGWVDVGPSTSLQDQFGTGG